jgi:hypothetical protein
MSYPTPTPPPSSTPTPTPTPTPPLTAQINVGGNRCLTPGECVAPVGVFFDSHGTTCDTTECDNNPFENEAFHSLLYKWEFGDSEEAPGTWSATGTSRNEDYGPLAAHVYDDAVDAPFTVTLHVWSDSDYATDTVLIYVTDQEAYYAPTPMPTITPTVCISAAVPTPVPGAAGCPLKSAVDVESVWETAVESNLDLGRRRLLFEAGDTFLINGLTRIKYDGPGYIGSYGTANDGRAILDDAPGDFYGTVIEALAGGANTDRPYWVIADLEAVHEGGFGPDNGGRALTHALWQNNKKINSYMTVWEQARTDTLYSPEGVFLVDNHFGGGTGNNMYILFFGTTKGAVMGNLLGNPAEKATAHVFRSSGKWKNYLHAHNEHQCCAADSAATFRCSLHTDPADDCQYLLVRDNKFNNTRAVSTDNGRVSIKSGTAGPRAAQRDAIVEENRFETSLTGLWAKTVTVRNNIFVDDPNDWKFHARILVTACNLANYPHDWVDDIRIYNNSAFRSEANQHMILVNDSEGDTACLSDTHIMTNNLLWNPNSSSEVVYCDDGAETYCNTITETDSLGPHADDGPLPSNPFAVATPDIDDLGDWEIAATPTPAPTDWPRNTCTDLGTSVGQDINLRRRAMAGVAYDCGATEATPTPTPTP